MKFDKYHIASQIKRNLSDLGFKRPTDIQFKAIPSIMKGEDVLAIAQTGTGKTAAFAIPIIDKIHRTKKSKQSWGIKCIIMVPTRELAAQIGNVFNQLSKHTKAKAFAVYGGVEQDPQIKKLADGIDVLVATPGRMFDLISQGSITLKQVDTLVIDEADQMLDLGFIKDIIAVKKKLFQKHQTLFFSATINKEIKKLAFSQVKSSAIRIQISPEDPVSKNVSHFVIFIEMDDKRFFLRRFITDNSKARIIVFVRTRVRAERVSKALERGDIKSATIHGEKDQKDRTDVMDRFKSGEMNILIATDVSARGIDIADVNYVINYDLPEKSENYVHRVGRTGRGIKKGIAISFCSPEEKERLDAIQGFLNKKIEMIPISKKEHKDTIALTNETDNIQDLIMEQEEWEKKKRTKRKKKK
ncbi:MAG: DEAD/DEAH box helicase [Desulfobacula sp.]|jgi:ATP-dependent RNA helicase RhlE|uniref:DEAD/DEAH box helicase n=1 Tax=Desulfobacula sp. TaxID=2593537 RepID=UPI001D8D44AE|nr:DEAD/DEAH box helicase [Desulfobacula sp.]MBT3483916.1 DEAD/DEAH box helicase [Desulfobacula sp.]MBT3803897.1 DEAD/DEAH box helicase [Desulfobacula sp.]MBT4023842.1 DEAD/DEAH box helicase [Desulfobacula sp.]MBT4197598.1 DEAD/DEAH box helicase [Desulfobacula sp.]